MHGHGERGRAADALPERRAEARDDASLQLRPAAGAVRGPPRRHGEAPVLPRLWLLLQGGESERLHIGSCANVRKTASA